MASNDRQLYYLTSMEHHGMYVIFLLSEYYLNHYSTTFIIAFVIWYANIILINICIKYTHENILMTD